MKFQTPLFATALTVLLGMTSVAVAGPFEEAAATQEATEPAEIPQTEPPGAALPDLAAVITGAGYPASPDADGDFVVTLKWPSGRQQSGWVLNQPQGVGNLTAREVRSVAAILSKPLSKKNMARLMLENGQTLGGWQVYQNDGQTYVVYSLHVPVDVSSAALDSAIQLVLDWADQEEKILTGADVQ